MSAETDTFTMTPVRQVRQVRRLSLRGVEGPVGRARDFVRQTLTDWRWHPADSSDEAVQDVLLVVSELVANATAHAAGATEIALAVEGSLLTVSVADADPRPPAARPAEPSRPGGHGLKIVEMLAAAWGTTPGPHGKTVWATFRA
jgi:hypothetical protein